MLDEIPNALTASAIVMPLLFDADAPPARFPCDADAVPMIQASSWLQASSGGESFA
ncbi:hypothetical protein RISK_001435 [Rhodopirellula islandica]|uniref:Uncharacterized protein n=1 Tax=Rhodopirellula islandica TaxID=595434 RepID=A0A0J1EKZ2_RHOIS|nr:hypothetical protein RISK_001435 [Rhodopirellula islandica]